MGEIRIVGSGKTREYPYPVCQKKQSFDFELQSSYSVANREALSLNWSNIIISKEDSFILYSIVEPQSLIMLVIFFC